MSGNKKLSKKWLSPKYEYDHLDLVSVVPSKLKALFNILNWSVGCTDDIEYQFQNLEDYF